MLWKDDNSQLYAIVKYRTISSVGRILINAIKIGGGRTRPIQKKKTPFPRGDSGRFSACFHAKPPGQSYSRIILSRFHTCLLVTGSDVGGDTFPLSSTHEIRAHEFSHANGHLETGSWKRRQQFRRSLRYPRWNPRDRNSLGLLHVSLFLTLN